MRRTVRALGIAGLLVPVFLATVHLAAAEEDPQQQPAFTQRYGNSGVESTEGLTRGVEAVSPILKGTRQQFREAMREFAKTGGKAAEPIKVTQKVLDFAEKVKTVGKVFKVVDAVMDAGEVAKAYSEGGTDAAVMRATDVGLNEGAAYLGATVGAKYGAIAGTALGGPGLGTLIGGIVGGTAGAFAVSLGYEWTVKPVIDGTIKDITDERKLKKAPPKYPGSRETHPPGVTPPPELGPKTPFGETRISDPVLRCTALRVVPLGDVEAGAAARFMAFADLSLVTADGLPETTQRDADVTSDAVWTFSSGVRSGQGQATTDCGMAGQAITATATYLGQTSAASVSVKALPLVTLTLSASPASAPPGGMVTLTAEATYKNAYCEENKSDPPGIVYASDPGALVSGRALTIDLDKESGSVVAYASLPQAGITSNLVSINVIPPTLERITLSAPPAVDVCQVVTFNVQGYYSHRPDVAKPIPPDEVTWSISGRCDPVGVNSARASWPGEVIKASATTPEGRGAEAVVTVNPLPRTSPWFPIEDVSSFADVKVGQALKNVALEFACEGSRHAPRPSTNVEWRSDTPDVLSCSPDGVCQGLQEGTAIVTLYYGGREITSRPVTVTAGEDEFEAGEELTGDELEAAAAEPQAAEKNAENAPVDKKNTKAFKLGEKMGRLLAGALGEVLEKEGRMPDTAPKGKDPGKGTDKPAGKPSGASNDPFVGNWRLTSLRITQHSEGPDQEDLDDANRMAASVRATMAIRSSAEGYSVSGLGFAAKKATASGSALTIIGRDAAGKTDEEVRLILKGDTLAGTWRTTFDPDYFGRREWQVAEVSFSRQ